MSDIEISIKIKTWEGQSKKTVLSILEETANAVAKDLNDRKGNEPFRKGSVIIHSTSKDKGTVASYSVGRGE